MTLKELIDYLVEIQEVNSLPNDTEVMIGSHDVYYTGPASDHVSLHDGREDTYYVAISAAPVGGRR